MEKLKEYTLQFEEDNCGMAETVLANATTSPSVIETQEISDSEITDEEQPWKMTWDEINEALGPKSKEEIVQRNIEFFNSKFELDFPKVKEEEVKEEDLYKESLTPGVLQSKGWRTPTEFPLCPVEVSGGLDPYLERLGSGKCFCKNKYSGASKIVKAAKGNHDDIIVYTEFFNEKDPDDKAIKPYALAIIHIVGDKYVHDSYKTFFEAVGAEKYFTLMQGKEWTGGDVLDDYC